MREFTGVMIGEHAAGRYVHNSEKIEIDVTNEDIKNGLVNDGENCPVALAATRKFGFSVFAKKCTQYVYDAFYLHFTNNDVCILLSDEVMKKIQNFDDNGKMEPFTFKIPVVKEKI